MIEDDVEDDSLFKNWLAEKYEIHGLVGLVNVKGFECDYEGLVGLLEECGIAHNLDAVYKIGLGNHVQRVFEMACDGFSSTDIAAALGAKTKTVTRFCNRHGIELMRRPLVADFHADIVKMAADGMPSKEIAEELPFFSRGRIKEYAKANGIEVIDTYHKGYILTESGYKLVPAPEGHPYPDCKGYIREHRLVMEAHLGRYLEPHEIVHHKDRNTLNNTIDNLQLTNASEHSKLHAQAGEAGWAKYHSTR